MPRYSKSQIRIRKTIWESTCSVFRIATIFETTFSTWLHRLAVNTALMELRARKSRPQSSDDEDALDNVGTDDSAGHVTALSMDLERAVATLPPRARAVLVLHDVEGWKHEEIATELGMAVGSSKAQLHRARGLLRTRLGGHHEH